jgi:hypothetical protein
MELSGILKYGGYGLGGLLLLLVILWIVTAARIVKQTKGLPQALNNFFAAIVSGKLDAAYAMTTKAYRNQFNRKDFIKFIKQNNLKQYKTSKLSAPLLEGGFYRLNITAELQSGDGVPLSFLWKQAGETWQIEQLIKVGK